MNLRLPTNFFFAAILAASPASKAVAQALDVPPISIGDSSVGYIDSAVPADQFRLRFDAAYDANQPNRGEFLWGWPPASGPGPPLNETSTDDQQLMFYVEKTLWPSLSGFVELPLLFINPDINANTSGIGDIQAGAKWAFFQREDFLASLQLRVWAPSGDASRALGVGHTSLEPELLLFHRHGPWNLEGELRYLVPLDGTPTRQSPIFRYGVGVSRDYYYTSHAITPVVELVGWTLIDGGSRFVTPGGAVVVDPDTRGETIVNIKVGARAAVGGSSEIYAGYGRALTGDRWYRDILRFEWRRTF